MSAAVAPAPSPPISTAASGAGERSWHRISVTTDIAALEEDWRSLEARALLTPYQAYDWVRSFVETVGRAQAMSFRFVRLHDPAGRTLALLPLVITRRHGTRFAEFIGGKHANYHMGLYEPGFAAGLDAPASRTMLLEIGSTLDGIDALVFVNQPVAWHGVANPAARLASGASPSRAYKLALQQGDPEGTLRRSMSKHARKKLTTKRNRFSEIGPSELVRARDEAGIARILRDFLRQKAARFAAMGIPDPFAAPAIRDFLRKAATGTGTHAPAVELYSLDLSGKSVATYICAVQGEHVSGMATSFDMAAEAARFSPGEILLLELIALKCHEGVKTFDLGVGEARYKTTICDDCDELVDTFLPLTARGRAYAGFSRMKRNLKRRIKASPTALKLAQRMSGLLGRRAKAEGLDE